MNLRLGLGLRATASQKLLKPKGCLVSLVDMQIHEHVERLESSRLSMHVCIQNVRIFHRCQVDAMLWLNVAVSARTGSRRQ